MKTFTLEVWGGLACFTRPEFKVERFSYPIITPSAARAIFDAIYLDFSKVAPKKPVMYWQITQVEVLQPLQYIALMRNEVKEKISEAAVQKWIKDPSKFEPIYADATEEESGSDKKGRTQRQTMALKNVRYRIQAHIVLYQEQPELRQKLENCFQRRARNGQCFYQPYLGCREFSAYFELLENTTHTAQAKLINETVEVGWMLYDVFDLSRPGSSSDAQSISLFNARIENGVLNVPAYSSSAVHKPKGGA
jgi:CRISPR-associated protein Cas5d